MHNGSFPRRNPFLLEVIDDLFGDFSQHSLSQRFLGGLGE